LKELKASNTVKNGWTLLRDTVFIPENPFKGSVYVLINSDIHSAAAITAALLKYNTSAIFLGTPVSGPYNSGNAIDLITVTLPKTGINMYVPVIHYSYAIPDNVQPEKNGLSPDRIILPGVSDLINNKDVLTDSAISIIKFKAHKSEIKTKRSGY